jgi:hypothetical protein
MTSTPKTTPGQLELGLQDTPVYASLRKYYSLFGVRDNRQDQGVSNIGPGPLRLAKLPFLKILVQASVQSRPRCAVPLTKKPMRSKLNTRGEVV